ncbi:hypothetical protein Droror1_Dr00002456 [Drosera rotundifolia]
MAMTNPLISSNEITFSPDMSNPISRFLLILFTLTLTHTQSHPATSLLESTSSQLATSGITTLSVADFGAAGDGIHYDTIPIQSAINSCPSPSPCHVTFPPGRRYLTGTLRLVSGVRLVIPRNTSILGGTNRSDYGSEQSQWYVILAEDAENVGVIGEEGVVDGQGGGFVERYDERKNVMVSWNGSRDGCEGDECRPRLVGFVRCKGVRVEGVSLVMPAYWCLHIVECDNTVVRDVTILGDFNTPNNDGIDIQDSNNTFITRCTIDTGDDAICPKTYNGPLYNLTATNCWIRTKSSAIKLGSASWFEFKGLLFDNITIFESHRGLGLQIRDGGNVSDVTFSNINISTRYYDPSWWGRAEPIYVTTCPRNPDSATGSLSNIGFINVTAVSENGVFLSGSPNGLISDLKFSNVKLSYKRWTNHTGGLVDYRPGCSGLVNHRMAGVIMEYIDGFEIEDVKMRWSDAGSGEWDNPLDFHPSTVNNLSFVNFYTRLYSSL